MYVTIQEDYEVITPGCGCKNFAVPASAYKQWKRTKATWHCPTCGGARHFTGESTERKKIRELEQKLAQKTVQIAQAESDAQGARDKYSRMRKRVFAGVCPCCNRHFENVQRHMETKHKDMSLHERFKHKRILLGLTQWQAQTETGVNQTTISAFENGKHVSEAARNELEWWVENE